MSEYAGTGRLLRLILRRDRLLLPLWVLFLAVIPLSFALSFEGLFPTAAERHAYAAASADSASFVALYGRLYGEDIGTLVAWRSGFVPVLIGLFSLLTVIRHTRTEEDTGRRELLGATVVGRRAGLAAALVAAYTANLVLGATLALGQVAQGLPLAGSVAMGVEFALVGWVFAAVGAVAAQVAGDARGARALAVVALGAAFVLRLVGDVSAIGAGTLSWLSWLSPVHWAHELRPYAGERWWPAALAVAVTAVLTATAGVLAARRDVGAGLLPPRLGPAGGAPGLASPLALAWRLHRGLLVGWVTGFAVLGVVLGGVAEGVGDVAQGERVREIFDRLGGASDLVDSYLAGMLSLLGLIAAGYAIQAALRLREEEAAGRAEPVLSTGTGRLRWAGGHLLFSALGPVAALLAAGLAVGVTYGLSVGDLGQVPRVLAGALVQLPAVWLLAAVAVGLLGLAPRLAPLAWGALVVSLLVTLVGGALGLDQWVLDLSPFTHVPHLPGGTPTATPLAVLGLLAAGLAGAGLAGLTRRDLPVS